jgi:hypothetical protein
MSKKHKSSQFPQGQKSASSSDIVGKEKVPNLASNTKPDYIHAPLTTSSPIAEKNAEKNSTMVQPEQMSLTAHSQIKQYLTTAAKIEMDKEDLNEVLRLSQHLRLFGLLSAVGYVNQSNAQGGKVRDRTVPVWSSLLGQMLGKPTDATDPNRRRELMETVVEMARNQPSQYMANWRKSMMLSEQWNFWARAYSKGE